MDEFEIRIASVGKIENKKDLDAASAFLSNIVLQSVADGMNSTAISPATGELIHVNKGESVVDKITSVIVSSPRQMFEALKASLELVRNEREAQHGEIYMEENQVIYHDGCGEEVY